MNIKEYYSFFKKAYFNQIMIISVFITLYLILLFNMGIVRDLIYLFYFISIILLYSLLKYHYYLYREAKASIIEKNSRIIHSNKQFLWMVPPEDGLTMKMFKSNGICEWEITEEKKENLVKRMKKRFIVKKRNGCKLAYISYYRSHILIEIIPYDKNIQLMYKSKTKHEEIFEVNVQEYTIMKQSTCIKIRNKYKLLSKMEIGIMPISWQKRFSANTPVIEFNENIKSIDFFIVIGLLVYCQQKYKQI